MIPLIPFLWLLNAALSLALALIGAPLIAIALALDATAIRTSQTLPRQITAWAWRWMWLWGNEEDGIDPAWYAVANPSWSDFRRIFAWTAIRNSVNNLQRVPYLNCKLDPAALKSRIWSWGFWCRQGPYAGGRLFIGSKQIVYGYGFYPRMQSHSITQLNDTRDLPYIGPHWGISAVPTAFEIAALENKI